MVLFVRFDAVHIVPGSENGTFYARALNMGEAIFKVRICFCLCFLIIMMIRQNLWFSWWTLCTRQEILKARQYMKML